MSRSLRRGADGVVAHKPCLERIRKYGSLRERRTTCRPQSKKTCNATPQPATIFRVSQNQDDLYRQATDGYGDALGRLVRAYERDSDKRRDLLQETHLALWRSFERFEARCSLRAWIYRVAHNIAISHVIRQRRK